MISPAQTQPEISSITSTDSVFQTLSAGRYLGAGRLFPFGPGLVSFQFLLVVFLLNGVALFALAAAIGGVPALFHLRRALLLDGLQADNTAFD